MDFALNNLQSVESHKTQTNNNRYKFFPQFNRLNIFKFHIFFRLWIEQLFLLQKLELDTHFWLKPGF